MLTLAKFIDEAEIYGILLFEKRQQRRARLKFCGDYCGVVKVVYNPKTGKPKKGYLQLKNTKKTKEILTTGNYKEKIKNFQENLCIEELKWIKKREESYAIRKQEDEKKTTKTEETKDKNDMSGLSMYNAKCSAGCSVM